MGEKLVIGPFTKGLTTIHKPFNIDNDAFPKLINAFQWRGRVHRKRGTLPLTRLTYNFNSSSVQTDGSGNFTGNLITLGGINTNSPNASIVFNSISVGSDVFTDPSSNGILVGSTGGSGTINYATGALTLTGAPVTTNIVFSYYPDLPVMGLRDLSLGIANQFPGTIGFDTKYAYNIATTYPYTTTNINFYKNPLANGTLLPLYVPKSVPTSFNWNGTSYQQFWSVNYQGAFWATNGITQPFTTTNIGMQYAGPTTTPALTAATWVNSTTMTFTIAGNPLVVGDFVFANEFTSTVPANALALNKQTGYVTAQGNTFTVVFPFATLVSDTYTPGILQYLTNTAFATKDVLRWYDGNSSGQGWVNFAPPISNLNFSIDDLMAAQYYLVGARYILPFKDRLLFFGPVVQSSTGTPMYLEDTVIYSQNGTPFYNASFTGDPTLSNTVYSPILAPANQTATASAYFSDVTGYGGFIVAGIDQPIVTVGQNEDSLIIGFDRSQSKLLYTSNDIIPFVFYVINSEYGSSSTFSSIVMDEGVLSRGNRGFVITNQQSCQRFDVPVIDIAFEMNLSNNGTERICSQRDFENEWIYFTYCSDSDNSLNPDQPFFPDTTLFYNYRDKSFAQFIETYTTYGQFRETTGVAWNQLTTFSWQQWNTPWIEGDNAFLQPRVIAGNQQGFVLFRDDAETYEAPSLYIKSISGVTITSPSHSLHNGDYIIINGVLGTLGTILNGNIYQINTATLNTFNITFTGTGTYLGGGTVTRLYNPFIQTKQFPLAWGMARKTRIGPQMYYMSKTPNGQVTLNIYLSTDIDTAYNAGNIVPQTNVVNSGLIYSTVLYTCPESTNLGLTPANINLQMVTGSTQEQIWHRINTSLIGDTVQFAITLSPTQMMDPNSNQVEVSLHGIILDITPSMVLV